MALVTFFRDTAFRLGGAWNLCVEGICPDDRTITSVELKARDRAPHTVYMSDALLNVAETNPARQGCGARDFALQ